ncbi:MAG TPA: DHA2 family efflux MFS transporter permease subunit [Mycobacteriales bacterium]|nr:DHA2 family efflux MFS transporter permease subunit [Mycobacteriales bacterium]
MKRSAARPPLGADVWRVCVVVILGMVMSTLDTTIVNVALISLSRDLKTSLDTVQWVVTGYLLALAAVIPTTGWAAKRYGTKRLFLISIVVFTFGSALCGLSPSIAWLIAFRVLQGVGGGMIVPLGMMLVVKKAGPQRLARVMSAISVPVILGPVVGPTIGGLLLDHAGWRWIFYVNLPVGVAAFVAALRLLPADQPEDAGPLDISGLAIVAPGLVGITYGLAKIGVDPFLSATVLAPLLAGAALVTVFVIRALRVDRPLLDMRLYKDKSFSAASLTTFCLGAAMFGGLILMPLYFQTVRGEDALRTGLLLGPQGIGSALAVWWAGGLVDRYGAGLVSICGALVSIATTVPFLFLGAHTAYLPVEFAMLARGLGVGLSSMPAMTAALRGLTPDQVNDATPQINVVQRVGSSIGTAILTVILQNHLDHAGTAAGQAHAFGVSFGWVLAITAVASLPTVLLWWIERRARLDGAPPLAGEVTSDALVGAA